MAQKVSMDFEFRIQLGITVSLCYDENNSEIVRENADFHTTGPPHHNRLMMTMNNENEH